MTNRLGHWRDKHSWRFFLIGLTASAALIAGGGTVREVTGSYIADASLWSGISIALTSCGFLLLVVVCAMVWIGKSLHRAANPHRASPAEYAYVPPQGPATAIEAHIPVEPKDHVSILMLGFSGCGKTLLLTSLYRHFSVGGAAGIRFATDPKSNKALTNLAIDLQDPDKPFPPGTQPAETKEWLFKIMIQTPDGPSKVLELGYLDYAGGYAEDILAENVRDPPDEVFQKALHNSDVLMGVLDGAKIRRLMDGDHGPALVAINSMVNILTQAENPNIHLVITKWDLMRKPGGGRYTLAQVVSELDETSTLFRDFRRNPALRQVRIIPVSALGVDGFACPAAGTKGPMVKSRDVIWEPWNAEMPFYFMIPDIVRHDITCAAPRAGDMPVPALRKPTAISVVTAAAVKLANVAGLSYTANKHGTSLHMSIGETIDYVGKAIDRIRAIFADRRRGRKAPPGDAGFTAIGHLLDECYASTSRFEEDHPGLKYVEPPSAVEPTP